MLGTSGIVSQSLTRKSRLRVGLISDTHEAENPACLVARLGSRKCDLHVHLGDVGGSRLASRIVREFKQTLGNTDHLTDGDRRRFEDLEKQGLTPMWAYIETRLGADPASRERRAKEARESYTEVVGAMSKLPNSTLVSGNIDNSILRSRIIGVDLDEMRLPLMIEPELLDLGSRALVFWPSMKGSASSDADRLNQLVDSYVRLVNDKDQVIVFAHEQIYKGPSPAKYKENVESAGYQAMTVPRFEPNPCWPFLLRFFRLLRPSQDVAMVYGHVHDPHHVIQAGAPYLKGSLSGGLRYRLYGLGSRGNSDALCSSGRRTIRLFTIPADAVAVLHLTPKRMRLEVIPWLSDHNFDGSCQT